MGTEASPKAAEVAFLCAELVRRSEAVAREFFADTTALGELFSALDTETLTDCARGYFAIAAQALLSHRPADLVDFLFSTHDYSRLLVAHLRCRAIAEFLGRVLSSEHGGSKFAIGKMDILDLVVDAMTASDCLSTIANCALVLREMIDNAQDLMGWKIYMAQLLQSHCIKALTDALMSKCSAKVVACADTITALLTLEDFDAAYSFPFKKVKRPSKQVSEATFDALELLAEKLEPLATVLGEHSDTHPNSLATAAIVRLLTALVNKSTPKLERCFVSHRILLRLCRLFAANSWSSLVHSEFTKTVTAVLSSSSPSLKYDLLVTAELPRCLYEIASSPYMAAGRTKVRKGNLGHVTLLGCALATTAAQQPLVCGCVEQCAQWRALLQIVEMRGAVEQRRLGEEDPPTAPDTPCSAPCPHPVPLSQSDVHCIPLANAEAFASYLFWKLPLEDCRQLGDLD